MEKAIEEHLLNNSTESLSVSSSGSDFVVIDRNSLSNDELIEGLVDAPNIIYHTDWNTTTASLPDDTSESDDSCEAISVSEETSAVSYASAKANVDGSEQCDMEINTLGSSPVVTDYVEQKNDED
ncbi:unnamed protein product [Cercopithifilaria johnstoni]|uniref:Uncharacterized protein n=1 Tax=Cercopithifilaria johnstoni TaxID=2874296 RepID=A0A8J2LWV4_9BILA|nr:unnamed protein product [Cercopithifilaria johnstoni]